MTLDEEVALAIGRMGMGLETYLRLTPHQFKLAYDEHEQKRKEDREAAELSAWQVARWQVWRMLRPPDKKSISQFDLIELPEDKLLKEILKDKKKQARSKKPRQRDERRFRAIAEKWRE